MSSLLVYLACCLATLELRRRDIRSDGPPFLIPGGPTIPIIAALVVLWLLSGAAVREFAAVAGVLVIASVLYLVRRQRLRSSQTRDL